MIIVRPSYKILHITKDITLIEKAGRICYKSQMSTTGEGTDRFLAARIESGHESILEHSMLSVHFICDRGVSHELVRHRLASYSQESTRYCNYSGGIVYILPPWLLDDKAEDYAIWIHDMARTEVDYLALMAKGWTPQMARTVLPNSVKTEIIVTANFREWRHILKLRTAKAAHPQMQELMRPLLLELRTIVPIIFDDITFPITD